MGSWKTSSMGIGAMVVAIGSAITQFSTGGLESIDWTSVIVAVLAGLGLIGARDNGVTSEQAGAKK